MEMLTRRFWVCFLALSACVMLLQFPIFAQTDTPPTAAAPVFTGKWGPILNLGAGVGVSLLIAFFKRWSLVNKYPKVFTLLLSAAVSVAGLLTGIIPGDSVEFIKSVLTQLVAAVGFHETVTKSLTSSDSDK